jgi:hypothetical protein
MLRAFRPEASRVYRLDLFDWHPDRRCERKFSDKQVRAKKRKK